MTHWFLETRRCGQRSIKHGSLGINLIIILAHVSECHRRMRCADVKCDAVPIDLNVEQVDSDDGSAIGDGPLLDQRSAKIRRDYFARHLSLYDAESFDISHTSTNICGSEIALCKLDYDEYSVFRKFRRISSSSGLIKSVSLKLY